MAEKYYKIKKYVYLLLFIALIITFFTRNNYKGINEISPEVLNNPIQTETADKNPIQFTKNDFRYKLTPLYDYEINTLIVHKMDYTWFSIYKTDSVFPMDLCTIWGRNVKDKTYQDKSLKFSQDIRYCFAQWQSNLNFNNNEVANNHLVTNDEALEKKLKKISVGDQVKIKGQLVNIEATNLGEPGRYDPEKINWETSTTREDTAAGACEIIYLKNIEIIKKANPLSYNIFNIGKYALLFLIIFDIIIFFIKSFRFGEKESY